MTGITAVLWLLIVVLFGASGWMYGIIVEMRGIQRKNVSRIAVLSRRVERMRHGMK